jgi:hypothetical protein
MESFREIIDAFGVARLSVLLGIAQSHVRTMKVRNVIPPQYWRKIIEAWPGTLPPIDLPVLDDLYTAVSREKEGEAAE